MEFPAGTKDMSDARLKLTATIDGWENALKGQIDRIANSSLADKRLCAMAWTDIEKGLMALKKALAPRDQRDYGKTPVVDEVDFNTPVDADEYKLTGTQTALPKRNG